MRRMFNFYLLALLLMCGSCTPDAIVSGNIYVKVKDSKPVITKVTVNNDQLIITGKNLDEINLAKIEGSTNHTFQIESKAEDKLILNAKSALSLLVGEAFNLIVSNAQASATFPISFELQNGQVTAAKLHHMGASSGQFLRFNGTNWAPASISTSQIFAGAYDAATDTPDIVAAGGSSGTYYIVTVAGSQDLGSGMESFDVGDWVIYNGSVWSRLAVGTNTVSGFNGRTGLVVPLSGDYSWSMLTKAAGKLTGSKVSEIADVDVTGIQDGDILQWNVGTSKWEVNSVPTPSIPAGSITNTQMASSSVDSANITDGSIVNADISATAAIAQSKIQNLTTDLAAKEPLLPTGGTTAQYLRGNKTLATLDTSVVPENGNQYFTAARVLNTLITSYATGGSGAIAVTDTIPQALSKLETKTNSLTNYVLRDGSAAMTGDLQMGNYKITGLGTPSANTDAATKKYVDDSVIAAGGSQWTTTASDISYSTGSVGIGITTPHKNLQVHGNGVQLTNATTANGVNDGTWINPNGLNTQITNREAGELQFGTNDITRLTIKSTGEIEVAGDISVNGLARLKSTNTNFVELKAPAALAATLTFNLPGTYGTNNQVLTTDGAGNLSWTTASAGGAPTGAAGGDLSGTYPNPTITALNATKIAGGTVDNTEFAYLNGVTSAIQTQLDAKEATITAGTTAQYLRGNKTLATLDTSVVPENGNQYFTAARVQSTLLSTYATGGTGAIAVTDTIPQALSKLETKANTAITGATQWTTAGSDIHYTAGKVGIGTTTPGITTVAGRAYLTVKGSTDAGVLELASGAADADEARIGLLQFSDVNNAAADKKVAWIYGALEGTTANNRGGYLAFYTKTDGVVGVNERMRIDSAGNVGIGTNNPLQPLSVQGNASIDGDILIKSNVSAHSVVLRAPSGLAAPTLLIFPSNSGSNNQVLTTDGAGNLSWTTPAGGGGGAPTGAAGGDLSGTYPNPTITALNATKVAGGTVDNTEFSYLNGVTSSLQTQLDAKEAAITAGTTAQYLRGNKTLATLDTSVVPENGNQYFTAARVQSTLLTAYATGGSGAIAITDTIPQALSKLETKADAATANFANYVLLNGTSAMTGDLQMGTHKITGLAAPAANTDAATKKYVDDAITGVSAGSSQWTTTGSNIYYNTGDVGVGTATPGSKLDVAGKIKTSGSDAYLEMHDKDTLYSATPQAGLVFRDSGNSQYAFIGPIVSKMQFASWLPIELNVNNNIGVHVATDGNVGIGGTTTTEKLYVSGNAAVTGNLRLKSDNANFVNLRAPASLAGNLTFTFPGAAGTSGQALTTDGSGNLSWATVGGGSTAVGGDLTGTVSAAQIAAGAIVDADISASAAIDQSKINGLTTALSGKEPTITAGSTAQYIRGDKTLSTFSTDVQASVILVFSPVTGAAVLPSDSMLMALQKLQGQIDTHTTAIAASTAWTKSGSDVHYTAGNVGIGTTTPGSKIDVVGEGRFLASTSDAEGLKIQSVYSNNESSSRVLFAERQDNAYGWSIVAAATANPVLGGTTLTGLGLGTFNIVRHDGDATGVPALTIDRTNGKVGIGTTTPVTKLDVAGGIRPGSETAVTTCGLGAANGEGTQRYNYTTHRMEYCDGGAWVAMNAPKASYGTLTMLGASNCLWQHNNSSWTRFSADTDCAAATVTGAALAPTEGKIPAIRFASLPAGEYEVHFYIPVMIAANTGYCSFRISDGTNFSGAITADGDYDVEVSNLTGRFSYATDQTNITF